MTTGVQPPQPEQRYQIAHMVVGPQPDQVVFPLTRDKFDLLMVGSVSVERSTRDTTFGALVGGTVGLICFFATADWDKHPICLMLLGAIVLACLVCCVGFGIKCHSNESSRVKDEIESQFGIKERK